MFESEIDLNSKTIGEQRFCDFMPDYNFFLNKAAQIKNNK
jgi:hypothetical protein